MAAFVQAEIVGNKQMQSYRWLHLRAVQRGHVGSQDKMRQLIEFFDPEGVETQALLQQSSQRAGTNKF